MKIMAAFGFVILTMSSLVAQEVAVKTYQLAKKGLTLPVGRKFLQKNKLSGKDAKIAIEVGEQTIDGTMNNLGLDEKIFDFLEKGKIRVSILSDQSKVAMTMQGNPAPPKETVKGSVGKVILLELKEGKWVGSVEKGEVLEGEKEDVDKEIKALERVFNENEGEALYGLKPRAVGERWDVDPKFMPGMGDLDVRGGKLSLHFQEVKEFQGDLCAVIETTFDVEAISKDEDMKGMAMNLRGSGRIVRSLSIFTEYKFVGEALFEMNGKVPPPAPPNALMKIRGDMNVDTRMTEIKEGE